MTILIVGGDSVEAIRQQARAGGRRQVRHWSGRKTRDVAKSIPHNTEAVVVILDRVSHALVQKVRGDAARRGIPVFFQRRGRQSQGRRHDPGDFTQWLGLSTP